jgi:hypothetical protein
MFKRRIAMTIGTLALLAAGFAGQAQRAPQPANPPQSPAPTNPHQGPPAGGNPHGPQPTRPPQGPKPGRPPQGPKPNHPQHPGPSRPPRPVRPVYPAWHPHPGLPRGPWPVFPGPGPRSALLGSAVIDARAGYDTIPLGAMEPFRAIQLHISGASIELNHVLVHYADGTDEPIPAAVFIQAGSLTRPLWVDTSRGGIESVDLWYRITSWRARPFVRVYGVR